MNHIGEIAALSTAVLWSFSGICFETAGRRVGSFSVNIMRLFFAFSMMIIFNAVTRGHPFPTDASASSWFWLSISGLLGLFIGDFFLFHAYVLIGVRISALVLSIVPPMTAILGFFVFGEKMSALSVLGMFITLFGICTVIFTKGAGENRISLTHPAKGILFAIIGAVGQSLGLITSKLGMGSYNAFAATQIRITAGLVGFIVLFFVTSKWGDAKSALKDKFAVSVVFLGSIFGPFIGVAMSLIALQNTKAGIASTLIAMVPVFIIPLSIAIKKERITLKEVVGAIIAVSGVAVMFVHKW